MITVFCNPLTELKRQRINSSQYRMVYANAYKFRCTYFSRIPFYFVVGDPKSSSGFGHYIVAMSKSIAEVYPLFSTSKFGTMGVTSQSNSVAYVYSRLSAIQATSAAISYFKVA